MLAAGHSGAPDKITARPLRGNLSKTLVVSELVKAYCNQGERAPLYFWRDSNGNEVDVIADAGGRLRPIEIKVGQTLNRDFFIGLERWLALAADQAALPVLIYGGAEDRVHRAVRVLPLGPNPYGFRILGTVR